MNDQSGPSTTTATVVALDGIVGASPAGDGVHWSLAADGDLNVNLVHLDAGSTVEAHTNRELDVVMIVLEGEGRLRVDGTDHPLGPHVLARTPKGSERSIVAGARGLSYLTVHRVRSPLGITTSPDAR